MRCVFRFFKQLKGWRPCKECKWKDECVEANL